MAVDGSEAMLDAVFVVGDMVDRFRMMDEWDMSS